ncbi:hypothetical protein BC831DRAFT_443690 [Entophlyctis helioformis]|nr:hypothetical protein BC831DRAFT_443690 [Entophlyctis helioformis]
MSINASVLNAEGCQSGIELDVQASDANYPGQMGTFFARDGTLYLTNIRVVYLPKPMLPTFRSFEFPIQNLRDGKLLQPWFSANRYEGRSYHAISHHATALAAAELTRWMSVGSATVKPVTNGGLQNDVALKLTFNKGGGFEFSSAFVQLRSRISGEALPYEEPLPLYSEMDESAMRDLAAPPLIDPLVAGSPSSATYPLQPHAGPSGGGSGSSSSAPPMYGA